MRALLLLLLTMCTLSATAQIQEIMSVGGGTRSSNDCINSFTIGQAAVGPNQSQSYSITAGFEQGEGLLDTIIRYNIGEIPNQTVFSYVEKQFYVWSEELGQSADLSIEMIEPIPVGEIKFNERIGKFSFTPDFLDNRRYKIIFKASIEQDTVWQEVYFDINTDVQDEVEVFGLQSNRALPNDDDFIVVTSMENEEKSNFNHADRQTYSFGITGTTVVFDKNVKNGVTHLISNTRSDITELNIYAEKVVIRSALHFPQTDITIHARELIFEDNEEGEIASINTQPDVAKPSRVDNKPKNGIEAGSLTLYIDHFHSVIETRFRLIGGRAQASKNKRGGNGGSGGRLSSTINVRAFTDSPGGEAGKGKAWGNRGRSGEYIDLPQEHNWLHPYALKMIVSQAKAAYLNGDMAHAKLIFEDYLAEIEAYKESEEWLVLTQDERYEFDQLDQEIKVNLHRIASNQDYFGNPAGWVPMLSFEQNLKFFEDEIDVSMEILYFTYWIQKIDEKNEDKMQALQKAKKAQQHLLSNFEANYNEAIDELPRLEAEAIDITIEIDSIQNELIELEETLTEKAKYIVEERHRPKKKPWWRKAVRVVSTIAQVVPVFQPALGTIGQGLSAIADINFKKPLSAVKELGNVTTSIINADFKSSAQDFKQRMAALNPSRLSDLKPSAYKEYYESLSNIVKPIYNTVDDLRKKVGNTKAPLEEIRVELEKIRAESPEFNKLVNRVDELMVTKAQFEQESSKTIQKISTLMNDIQAGVLAIDGLNVGQYNLDSKRNVRAMIYIKDMERRAHDRLIRQHYHLAKAYEYRFLQPYINPEINLPKIFREFRDLVDTKEVEISSEQFAKLRRPYDDAIETLKSDIIKDLTKDGTIGTLSLRFELTKEDLDLLNSNQQAFVNLVNRGLFSPNEENLRIVDLEVKEVQLHYEGGQPTTNSNVKIFFQHTGISKLRKEGEIYHFNHYNQDNSIPIQWVAAYQKKDDILNVKKPSASLESLLSSLGNEYNKKVIYTRPAVWADISVTSEPDGSTYADPVIDKVVCELTYDFDGVSNDLITLEIKTNNEMLPYIRLSEGDINSRQDGWGNFSRTFFRARNGKVKLDAPEWYGVWKFVNWTDFHGNELSIDRIIEVEKSNNQMLRANYELIQPKLDIPLDTMYLSGVYGQESFDILNVGKGDMTWVVEEDIEWIQIIGDASGVNDGMSTIFFDSNSSDSSRVAYLTVIAPASIDYVDTIVVIQGNVFEDQSIPTMEEDFIRAFPNPSKDKVFLVIDERISNGTMTVTSQNGVVIEKRRIQSQNQILDVSNLLPGIYFIEVEGEKVGRSFKKILVN